MASEVEDIISKQNYITSSRYISGRIVEYDIRSANISVLRDDNVITQDDYEYLASLPKILREKEIGLREKADPTLYTKIQKGIKAAKSNLAGFNKIKPEQIVRIANDAVYINSELDLNFVKFGDYIEFKQKSEYNVYCNLKGILIFCKFAQDGNIHIDIKGLGDNSILHRDYMVYSILFTITLLERSGVLDAIDYVSELCEQYLHRALPVGYYREFNSGSLYKTIYTDLYSNRDIKGSSYGLSDIQEYQKYDIDINYNYTILRELWSILFEIYNMRR